MNEKTLLDHLRVNFAWHILLLLATVRGIGEQVKNVLANAPANFYDYVKTEFDKVWKRITEDEKSMVELRTSVRTLTAKLEEKEKILSDTQNKLFAQGMQLEEQMDGFKTLQNQMAALQTTSTKQLAALRGGYYELKKSLQDQSKSVVEDLLPAPISPPVGSPDHRVSNDGILLWKVSNIMQKRQDAILKKVPSILSPPFFTSERGYKLCARLYMNGDGPARGKYISLFFAVMKGPFDAVLGWPFKQKVKKVHFFFHFYFFSSSTSIVSVCKQKSVCPPCNSKTERLMANLKTDSESARFN